MSTGEIAITWTGALLALGILLGAGTKCSMDTKEALQSCIESTQKPLECKAAIGEGP